MFFDIYKELCLRAGETPTGVAEKLGVSRGTVSAWKSKGYTPRGPVLHKIAEYFGVSEAYLLGEETEKAPDVAADTEGGIDMDSVQFALFDGTRDLTAAQIEEVLGFVRYVKSRDEYRKAKENRSDGNDNGGTV